MCISERLRQVLEAKNITVTEFSNVTGISYRSAMNYLNEGRDPNVDGLVKIHESLGISITWLLTGNGNMFNLPFKETLSTQERRLLTSYRMMPDKLQKAFLSSFNEITSNIKD